MKLIYKITLLAIVPCLLILNGCTTGTGMIKCPELSAKKPHAILWAKGRTHTSKTKPANVEAKAVPPANNPQESVLASADNTKAVSFKLPAFISKKLSDNDQADMNTALGAYSANRISLQKKENGKMYVSAGSIKDLLEFAKNVSSQMHPRGFYERRYADHGGAAVAGGALGIVAFVFSFIPILNIVAIPLGLVAIILGAVGLRSGRRGMAAIGIVLGTLALLIGILFIFLYLAWLSFI